MPQLYGLPAGQPTTTRIGGQSGQQAGGGLDIDTAMTDLLSRLQLPQEQPVQPTSLPKKILAGLADALMVRAQTLAGQAPTGAGARDRQRGEETAQKQANQKTAEGNRQVRNEVVTSLYSQKLREDADSRSDKRQSDLIASRQAEDDKREEAKSTKAFIRDQLEGMAKDGFTLDPSLNPDELSIADILALKGDFYKRAGIPDKDARLIAGARTILELDAKHPELNPSFNVDEKTGELSYHVGLDAKKTPGQMQARRPPGSLTDAALLKIQDEYNFNPSAPEFLDSSGFPDRNKIMAKISEIRKDFIPLPPAQDNELKGHILLEKQAEEILAYLKAHPAGSGARSAGFATDDEERAFRALSADFGTKMLQVRAGLTVPAGEFDRYEPIYVQFGKLHANNVAAANQLLKTARDNISLASRKGVAVPQKQVDEMRRRVRNPRAGLQLNDDDVVSKDNLDPTEWDN